MAKIKNTVLAKNNYAAEGQHVCVALNHPSGLCFKLPDGREVSLAGNAVNLRGTEKGVLPVGGFGLTRIAQDDWEFISAKYAHLPIFKNNLVFAHENIDKAEDHAMEMKSSRHGREPVNTDNSATDEALKN